MKFVSFLVLITAFVLCACPASGVRSIEREDLFSLDIGPMEDQIAMYKIEGDSGIRRTGFAMRDGLFYIADGNGGKIVRYNSYGDLLFMIYNAETNPEPASLKINVEDRTQVTRWAFSYPLREPGKIAVDSRKHIYAEDRLPPERFRFDPEYKSLLDSIILHFDADGRFIEYLGQEGIGGTPFSRIVGLYTSIRDELVVVCRTPEGWNIYWYNSSGTLLYLVPLKNDAIPAPPDWAASVLSVDNIMAAPDSRKLFFKVDYYRNTIDESTNTRTGIEPDSSIVWAYNVEDGSYADPLEVPLFESHFNENGRSLSTRMLYSMMGALRNGKVLLYFPDENGYSLLFLDTNSREQRRGYIKVDMNELQFNDFHLSAEGILSALLVDEWKVKLVWWRTDAFFGEGR
jgi:hypothetical protein